MTQDFISLHSQYMYNEGGVSLHNSGQTNTIVWRTDIDSDSVCPINHFLNQFKTSIQNQFKCGENSLVTVRNAIDSDNHMKHACQQWVKYADGGSEEHPSALLVTEISSEATREEAYDSRRCTVGRNKAFERVPMTTKRTEMCGNFFYLEIKCLSTVG